MENKDSLVRDRIKKFEGLKKIGNPYPSKFDKKHSLEDLRKKLKQK